jgi:holo-[acyl-carrier protein] synthase
MVAGVGVDVIAVARVRTAFSKHGGRVASRVFTTEELSEAGEGPSRWQRLAARFAAKEAVMKALGSGLWQIPLTDICIARHQSGRPCVSLTGRAAERAQALGITRILVSMSHERDYAVAHATALAGGE